ncbi:unnamed protein product [Paramecium pentaurelia]|uniref:Uncharacterized protein n=1 Tax=Paramecium pentaurelia TaxID=43138 RepID=A0A8S1VWG8_9CILI|nr:unnamed protein product [Paramecium pentaurelia]
MILKLFVLFVQKDMNQQIKSVCIKAYPDSCLEFEYLNGGYQYIRCYFQYQGRRQSLSENYCIEFQQNFALNRIMSQEEIQLINPFFKDDEQKVASYQCLKGFDRKLHQLHQSQQL